MWIWFIKKLWKNIVYDDFESILVLENNGKQNPESLKQTKRIACSYGYRLACVDDKFSIPFETYLQENAVYNFINSMIEENKYFGDVIKKHFNKDQVTTKGDNKDFKN